MNWPPPIGEFVLFQADGRVVDDGRAFATQGVGVVGHEREVRQAKATDRIKPDREGQGSFLTSGGEIGHIQTEARYEIIDPRRFLERVADDSADLLVRLALQRATVAVAADHTLADLRTTLSADSLREMLRTRAQATLDQADSGIRIAEVNLETEPQPPLYLQKSFEDFSKVRQSVERDVEAARLGAQEALIAVAGEHYGELETLVDEYEEVWQDDAQREDVLRRVDELLASGRISGEVFRGVSAARRYRSEIERTIGSEARRFSGLRAEWEAHPDLVVAHRLLDVRGRVMSNPSAELVYVPVGLGSLRLDISGLQHIRDARRRRDMDRREDDTWGQKVGSAVGMYQDISELKGDKAARQLVIDEQGRLRGRREDR